VENELLRPQKQGERFYGGFGEFFGGYGEKGAVKSEGGKVFSNRILKKEFIDKTLNSFNITKPGDYIHVQKNVFDTLLKEGFFTDTENRNRVDVNKDSGMLIETNKSGIDETFNLKNYAHLGMQKKIAKLSTVRMLPEIIKNGKLISDNVENQYGNGNNKKFAYITYNVEIDGNKVALKLDVKKSPQKNKFRVHHIGIIERANDFPASIDNDTEAGQTTIGNGTIITHPAEKVNPLSENSKKYFSDRGNGYDGYSMSNNARAAYESGEMPISKWTKAECLTNTKRAHKG